MLRKHSVSLSTRGLRYNLDIKLSGRPLVVVNRARVAIGADYVKVSSTRASTPGPFEVRFAMKHWYKKNVTSKIILHTILVRRSNLPVGSSWFKTTSKLKEVQQAPRNKDYIITSILLNKNLKKYLILLIRII